MQLRVNKKSNQDIRKEDLEKMKYINFKVDLVCLNDLRCGVTDMIYQALKKRERAGNLVVVTIDEYLTSQVCSKCSTRTLEKCTCLYSMSYTLAKRHECCYQYHGDCKVRLGERLAISQGQAYSAIIAVANTFCSSRLKIFTFQVRTVNYACTCTLRQITVQIKTSDNDT
ncbi:MAG: hypothetical protein EXX96DRAFT_539169 [Benjaminiella poitrasii]|nr:MAG: hypothetical protein EXX96DRAFT_539169 [Benjaminiella poitrasii]